MKIYFGQRDTLDQAIAMKVQVLDILDEFRVPYSDCLNDMETLRYRQFNHNKVLEDVALRAFVLQRLKYYNIELNNTATASTIMYGKNNKYITAANTKITPKQRDVTDLTTTDTSNNTSNDQHQSNQSVVDQSSVYNVTTNLAHTNGGSNQRTYVISGNSAGTAQIDCDDEFLLYSTNNINAKDSKQTNHIAPSADLTTTSIRTAAKQTVLIDLTANTNEQDFSNAFISWNCDFCFTDNVGSKRKRCKVCGTKSLDD